MRWAPCEHMSLNPTGTGKSLPLPQAHCARQCSREPGDNFISTTTLACPCHVCLFTWSYKLSLEIPPLQSWQRATNNSSQQQHRGDLGSQLTAAERKICGS